MFDHISLLSKLTMTLSYYIAQFHSHNFNKRADILCTGHLFHHKLKPDFPVWSHTSENNNFPKKWSWEPFQYIWSKTVFKSLYLHLLWPSTGGAGSEVWNRVNMIAPVKKFGRVRLSTNFPWKQIWRRMQTWKDDAFLLGFKLSRVQISRERFYELL